MTEECEAIRVSVASLCTAGWTLVQELIPCEAIGAYKLHVVHPISMTLSAGLSTTTCPHRCPRYLGHRCGHDGADKPTRGMGTNGGALSGNRRTENREHQHRMTTLTRTHPQTSKNHTHATDTICGHLFVFCFCLVCQNMRAYTPDRRMVLCRRSTTLFIRTPSPLCMAGWILFHRTIC